MTPSPAGAAIALAVYVAGLMLTFGVRTWQQYRRTGDSGIRPIASDASTPGRWGVALFATALLLGFAGPLQALLVPESTVRSYPWIWWTGLGMSLTGLVLVLASQQSMGVSWRIGVDPAERTGLVTTGLFAWVRNPIFTAMALAMTGVAVMTPNPASLAAPAALIIGMQLQVRVVEEPYLLRMHGEDYVVYANQTGRFIPGIGRGYDSA